MIDYLPLVVTFLLAILGLLLRTTHDPNKGSIVKGLTRGGWAVLVLLSLALTMGVISTSKRKQADRRAALRLAQRNEHDSTTAVANLGAAQEQLFLQRGAIEEARAASDGQIHQLDSTLATASMLGRNLMRLQDSLRAQGLVMNQEFRTQQQALRAEADRLGSLINTAHVRLGVLLPGLDQHLSDSVEIPTRANNNNDYAEQAFPGSPSIFPASFVVRFWRENGADCGDKDPFLSLETPSISFVVPTLRGKWTSIKREEGVIYILDWTTAESRAEGVTSFAELRGGCYSVVPSFDVLRGGVWAHQLETLWNHGALTFLSIDFGYGRHVEFHGGDNRVNFPVTVRLPHTFRWEEPWLVESAGRDP